MADIVINLTTPIDITAVNAAVAKATNLMVGIDKLDANETLQFATPISGVTDSIELGKVEGGSVSSKYNGIFLGNKSLGKVVPRRLIVRPIVAEMSDEPERYRRSYIAVVDGGLDPKKHPFETWLIQQGIELASQDLHNVLLSAKFNADEAALGIEDAFDAWGTIIEAEKTATKISTTVGNMVATGAITAANAGDKLLAMYRAMPVTFKKKKDAQMIISYEMGEMYDDWYKTEHDRLPNQDVAGQTILEGTNGKCKLVRTASFPDGSQMVILTTKPNMVYGFDKMGDLKAMKAFESGNPYKFSAAMKYVFGCQFVSIHPSEFCVNDQPLTPVV